MYVYVVEFQHIEGSMPDSPVDRELVGTTDSLRLAQDLASSNAEDNPDCSFDITGDWIEEGHDSDPWQVWLRDCAPRPAGFDNYIITKMPLIRTWLDI